MVLNALLTVGSRAIGLHRYSARRASMGSTFAAFRAGK